MKVEREITVSADRESVWDALTDPALLAEWAAEDVELDLDEGRGVFRYDDGEEREATVEAIDELERLAFRWRRGGGVETRVEFLLEAVAGGTRVVVVESAPAGPQALAGLAAGDWARRVELLAGHALRLVLAA